MGRLGGGIVAFGYDSGRLGGIVASGHDSGRARGGIEGFGHIYAIACFLGGTLGYNSYKAFLFDFDLPWQAM